MVIFGRWENFILYLGWWRVFWHGDKFVSKMLAKISPGFSVKGTSFLALELVAGVGFEPTTSGL
jgi:hypothetical protein